MFGVIKVRLLRVMLGTRIFFRFSDWFGLGNGCVGCGPCIMMTGKFEEGLRVCCGDDGGM